MAFFGASDEIEDAPIEHEVTTEGYVVWSDNAKTLNVFLALETQWEYVAEVDGEKTRTRLIWESLEILLRHTNGIPRRDHAKIFQEIRLMEKAALTAMAEETNKRREQRRIEEEARRT